MVRPRLGQKVPNPGERVRVEGSVEFDPQSTAIDQAFLFTLGAAPMPEPVPCDFAALSAGRGLDRWVEVRGTVRSVVEQRGRLALEITMQGQRVRAWVQDLHDPLEVQRLLLNATVRVRGVFSAWAYSNRSSAQIRLLVPDLADLVIENAGLADQFALPVTPMAELLTNSVFADTLVHVRGLVTGQAPGGGLTVADGSVAVRIQESPDGLARVADLLDVVGFPTRSGTELSLEDAMTRVVVLAPSLSAAGTAAAPGGTPSAVGGYWPLLTRAADIRSMSATEAERHRPARLRGVVTYYDRGWSMLFIQDASGGIYVHPDGKEPPLAAGELVEIDGVTGGGLFAPVLRQNRIQLLGHVPLPSPTESTLEQLLTGVEDSQWLALTGIVHSVELDAGHLLVGLGVEGKDLRAIVPSFTRLPPPDWVDTKVRVQGVCGARFNSRVQFAGVEMFAPSEASVQVIEPGSANAQELPLRLIKGLTRLAPPGVSEHRQKVRGVVTFQLPGVSLYLHDPSGNLYVRTSQTNELSPGDEIEAIGFPTRTDYSPALENTTFRRLGPGKPPSPTPQRAEQILKEAPDCELVKLPGYLLDRLKTPDGEELTLQGDSTIFQARLYGPRAKSALESLPRGALVELSGVCAMISDENHRPTSFRVLLRSGADVVVLKRPPWWTWKQTSWVLGALVTALLAGAGWVTTLRQRVHAQTEMIRQDLAREHALEDRYRGLVDNANDIIYTHDLEGNFTSLNRAGELILGYPRERFVRMNVAEIVLPEGLEKAQQMLQRKLAEGGRTTYVLQVLTSDRRARTLEISSRLVQRDDGAAEIQGIARDATERLELEAQLRHSQKLESLGQLAAGVAHEFNNIMTIIQGHASLIISDDLPPHKVQTSLKQISEAALRAGALTRQLLTFSRKQPLRIKPVDLNEIVAGVIRMLGPLLGSGIQVKCDYAPGLPPVSADAGMIEQVILNLAVNSRDAMPRGGKVNICTSLERVEGSQKRGKAESPGGRFVCLTFGDTGCGMDAKTMARVFDPFFTTKEVGKGTGLGLATVYGIIEQHRGWIDVSSQLDVGTTFRLYLPCADA